MNHKRVEKIGGFLEIYSGASRSGSGGAIPAILPSSISATQTLSCILPPRYSQLLLSLNPKILSNPTRSIVPVSVPALRQPDTSVGDLFDRGSLIHLNTASGMFFITNASLSLYFVCSHLFISSERPPQMPRTRRTSLDVGPRPRGLLPSISTDLSSSSQSTLVPWALSINARLRRLSAKLGLPLSGISQMGSPNRRKR